MPAFSYIAVDSRGQQVSGTLEAANQVEATQQIKAQGFFPTRITHGVAGEAAPVKTSKRRGSIGAIPSKTLTVFTRQLATLISAGLPLLRGLTTLLKQEKNANLKRAMASIAESVEGGSTFSDSLGLHEKIFSKLYVNMVKAGELGGVLDVVLARLAEFQEKTERIKGKVVSAMFYPVVVLFIALGIVVFLLMFIVPKFQEIFKDMLHGQALPGLTQFVIDLSEFVKGNFLIIFGTAAVLVVGFKAFASTGLGIRLLDTLKFKMPVLGDLISKTAISRFTRTLGTLVSSGVPILQALNITKETAGNYVLSTAIGKVHDSVKEGETIVTPLEASGIFPPLVISMIQVGEEVGKLPDMLVKVADVYDEEVDNAVAGLTSLLEPIMIVFLAVVVGVIVVALFLPMVSIINNLGSQAS